ncbi:PREDICTED: LOC18773314 isoform X1 [Prunus dulcis]|uniref:PREDICTED: LOC18773314 isoform X1 n=1 Tax=Prunus dulcis TaxID=3755 RepID=A0A5E4FC90_PRUDU|nr:PREDICTED: LOC18773314 isoform X1 [Prunus dulcis]
MELDDNYMETNNRKEINSLAVVLNNSESSEKIPSPAVCRSIQQTESSEQIPSPAEASKKP